MQLKRLNITNYSSFKETGRIDFATGINLIVGQNNAGKSALLRALDAQIQDERHRNSEEYRFEYLMSPEIQLDIELSGEEIHSAILKKGGQFFWPVMEQRPDDFDQLLSFLAQTSHTFEMAHRPGQALFGRLGYPLHRKFERTYGIALLAEKRDGRLQANGYQHRGEDTLAEIVSYLWRQNLFWFNAQRFSIGKCSYGLEERLSSNAANLPAVLARLQGEQAGLFRQLVSHVREIFSNVGDLTVAPLPSAFEIRVWATEREQRRELGFPLDHCGTGLAQVMAILTVAMTFECAVIVIDEISSFLHPAATKTLLRILQTYYAQHQYIVSTHSPEVLGSANPNAVYLVQRSGYDSTVVGVDLGKLNDLRSIASNLGVSMTDVFAADRVIWVEGPTEELCFPYIYKAQSGELPRGCRVIPVVATGDFIGKRTRPELIIEIYRRLTDAASPLVKQVTFSFDRETLSEQEMDDLRKRAANRLAFLPRRHFECYLLDPAAIATLISSSVPDLYGSVTESSVLDCLQRLGGDARFKAREVWNSDITNEAWLCKVDAALLIKAVCDELTESRLCFVKTRHSLELLKYIVGHKPDSIQSLAEFVKGLFEMSQSD